MFDMLTQQLQQRKNNSVMRQILSESVDPENDLEDEMIDNMPLSDKEMEKIQKLIDKTPDSKIEEVELTQKDFDDTAKMEDPTLEELVGEDEDDEEV